MSEKEMLDFVKALADADRLRIIGLLTQKPADFSRILTVMGFHPADLQHHLDKLLQSGVVRLTDGMYKLDTVALEKRSRLQFDGTRPSFSPEPDLGKNASRVLAAHLNPDGTIKTVPLYAAKLQVILEYLLDAFSVDANYTEKEVNMILARFHPDTAGLRRDLIHAGMLERVSDGTRYWRPK
jgi:hypothetical protein